MDRCYSLQTLGKKLGNHVYTLLRLGVKGHLIKLELHVVCPSTKGDPESDLTNLLVGLMQIPVSN